MMYSLIFKDLVQFFRTGEVRRSLGAYQWHPSAEFAGWGVPAHKGRSINAWNCCRPLKHAFFPTKSTVVLFWLIDQYPFFCFPQVSGKFRAELQKEELKNSYVFLLGGRSTKACGNIQIHRENVRKWRTWGPCFGDQVYQPRKDQHQESWLQLLQAVVAWWLQQLWLPCIWCSIQRWGLFWIQKGWLLMGTRRRFMLATC